MKPVFINTGNTVDFSDVNRDRYSLEALIRACDSPSVVLSKDGGDVVVDTVSFIVRTFKHNNIIHCTKTDKVLFEAVTSEVMPSGITLNDFMLVTAKHLLTDKLYTAYDKEKIVTSAFPVPFGIIERVDGTREALFQIAVNHEILSNLSEGYEYVPVEDFKNSVDFNKAYQQFKFTKEE